MKEEANYYTKSFFGRSTLALVILGVIALAVVWLWVSWLQGVSLFSLGGTVTTSEKIEQQISEKDVLDSLTSTATSSPTLSPAVLKSLTSSPAKKNVKPIDTTVLESLTSTE